MNSDRDSDALQDSPSISDQLQDIDPADAPDIAEEVAIRLQRELDATGVQGDTSTGESL